MWGLQVFKSTSRHMDHMKTLCEVFKSSGRQVDIWTTWRPYVRLSLHNPPPKWQPFCFLAAILFSKPLEINTPKSSSSNNVYICIPLVRSSSRQVDISRYMDTICKVFKSTGPHMKHAEHLETLYEVFLSTCLPVDLSYLHTDLHTHCKVFKSSGRQVDIWKTLKTSDRVFIWSICRLV